MKRTVLAAALLAAFSMPALADDADRMTTSATTMQSDMPKTAVKKYGCMNRDTAQMM